MCRSAPLSNTTLSCRLDSLKLHVEVPDFRNFSPELGLVINCEMYQSNATRYFYKLLSSSQLNAEKIFFFFNNLDSSLVFC